MALGHPDEEVACGCVRAALQFFAAAGDEVDHHFITPFVCTPGTEANEQTLAFLAGASRFECPIVARLGARFRFAPVSERWVEGRHAQAKANLKATRAATIVHTTFTGHPWTNITAPLLFCFILLGH